MADLISPGIQVKELDLTHTTAGTSSSIGAVAINAEKGPSGEVVTVSSETENVDLFGKPNASNNESRFTDEAF